jgi:hypothetical protein
MMFSLVNDLSLSIEYRHIASVWLRGRGASTVF